MSKTAATISGECSALDVLERREVLALLAQRMAKLPDIQKKILALYYHENKQLSEIATHFGLTEARTIQIHQQTVELLRNYVGNVLA
jgi:RNA polymerase sigma factor FliA